MGVKKPVCGDIADNMLNQLRGKTKSKGYSPGIVDFKQLDAEDLPFDDNSFDALISGMLFVLLPNQMLALLEMFRVLRPGGLLAISAHRMEWWPVTEKKMERMMKKVGFIDIQTPAMPQMERKNDRTDQNNERRRGGGYHVCQPA